MSNPWQQIQEGIYDLFSIIINFWLIFATFSFMSFQDINKTKGKKYIIYIYVEIISWMASYIKKKKEKQLPLRNNASG